MYNMEAKIKERANWTQQKKTWVRKKDRERKQKERDERKRKQLVQIKETPTRSITTFGSRQSEWNATTLARSNLPKESTRFATVVSNLVNQCTPKKQKALEELNISKTYTCRKRLQLDREVVKTLKCNKKGKTALKVIATRLLKKASQRRVSAETGLHRKTVKRLKKGLTRMRRSNLIDVKLVEGFYCREDISRPMPQKRFAMKTGPGYLLQISLKAAFAQFKGENPFHCISFSKFASLRPPHVRLLANTHREFCLCVYCVNVRYKMLVLSRLAMDRSKKARSENDIPDILLCPKSDNIRFHLPECLNGTCQICFDQEKTLRSYYEFATPREHITWNRWEKKEEDGKKRRVLCTKTGTGKELLDELVEDVLKPNYSTTFIQHLFTGKWQYMQYSKLKQTLEEECVLCVMDFAKNRTISYQDEIKSAFFGAKQVTMHPIVTYYRTEDVVIRDCLFFLSDDITHDYHSVAHFTNVANTYIEDKLGKPPKKIVTFSDGCGSQYKSKGPFADISLKTSQIDRNYFGSEHGKGEGDGEIGVVNRAVDRAVLGRQLVMNEGQDMFNWCQENLTIEEGFSQRHFFFVGTNVINRQRPFTEVKTVPGTRKIHQLRNVVGQPYTIAVRNLSCFCPACFDSKPGVCENRLYVSGFKPKYIRRVNGTVGVEVGMGTYEGSTEVAGAIDALTKQALGLGDVEDVPAFDNEEVESPLNEVCPDVRTEDTDSSKKLIENFSSGSYFKVKCGSKQYPAVIISTPEDYPQPPTKSVYGHYFERKQKKWKMDETPYLITFEEVLSPLKTPNTVSHGRRLLYTFSEFP